ncbi:hypothetical protein Bca101_006432 [Brassica carinata]
MFRPRVFNNVEPALPLCTHCNSAKLPPSGDNANGKPSRHIASKSRREQTKSAARQPLLCSPHRPKGK